MTKAKRTLEELREVNQRRLARKREREREYAKANREKLNEYRRARKAQGLPVVKPEPEGPKVKPAYHADWHGTTYTCPELSYRGLA
jgi:hypothetical protein